MDIVLFTLQHRRGLISSDGHLFAMSRSSSIVDGKNTTEHCMDWNPVILVCLFVVVFLVIFLVYTPINQHEENCHVAIERTLYPPAPPQRVYTDESFQNNSNKKMYETSFIISLLPFHSVYGLVTIAQLEKCDLFWVVGLLFFTPWRCHGRRRADPSGSRS